MTGDDDDRDDGRPDDGPIAEALGEMLASDDSGLCAGLLDLLAPLSDVGGARWVLHKAGRLARVAAPGGYAFHEQFAPEVIDAALGELAEAGLVTIDEVVFDDAGDGDDDDDADVAGHEPAGEPHGLEGPGEADSAGDEDVEYPDDLDEDDRDDLDDDDLDESAFDTVIVAPDAGKIIIARHVAAGTIAELGARACVVLEEAARSGAGIDSGLLADGMTACWDRLRPHLGAAAGELVKDLLSMRGWGLYSLLCDPDANTAGVIEFGENLIADYELALGPGHPDAWETRRSMATVYLRCQRYDEGIHDLVQLRADTERALPANDGEILDVRSDLALAYLSAGRHLEAVREYTQLLADCERILGPAATLTAYVRGHLGEAYLEVGRVAEGIELMLAAAAGLVAIFGPDFSEAVRLREAVDEARGQEAG
jgi:hypothetical protein